MLIDTSLSIQNHLLSYVNCVNNVIGTQRVINPSSNFTLYTFNTEMKTVHCNMPITKIDPISPLHLKPGGCTMLYDAVYTVVTKNYDNTAPTILIVVTDGEDNISSRDPDIINAIITNLKNKGHWFFIFLGASDQANHIGKGMGIDTCVLYNNTPRSIHEASNVINIAIAKATAISQQKYVPLCDKKIPDDVRDLMEAMGEMKIN